MKLTDTQLVLLSAASQREDGGIIIPDHLKGAGSHKPVTKLIVSGLIREVPRRSDLQEWRRDEEGGSIALIITNAGLQTIGLPRHETAAQSSPPHRAPRGKAPEHVAGATSASGRRPSMTSRRALSKPPKAPSPTTRSPLSKTAQLIALLQGPGSGAKEIASALGWLPHTTRAALTGLRKRGFTIDRERAEDGASIYRITGEPPAVGDRPTGFPDAADRKPRAAKTSATKTRRQTKQRSSRRSGAGA